MPSGRLTYGNPAIEHIFRHPMRFSADPSGYGAWEAYQPDGRRVSAGEYPLAQTLATGEVAHGEYHFACGDGVRRWIAVTTAPVRDASGRMTSAVVVCADVDEARRAEAVLTRDREELGRLVAERTHDLEETQAQLAQARRMEALGQLAGGVAHDFNNVIQAVQGGARLIEGRSGDEARVRRLTAMIAEAAGRGAAVTRRLLAFSRRADLRAELVDAAELLEGMREILVHTLGAGIEVRVQTLPRLSLLADKGQLETVLVNLATNARDAMGGNGTITLSAVAETLDAGGTGRPATLRAGAYVRLSVSDTGTGMDVATLARASEPFFTTKSVGQGTGLGLAMARGFAEQSGGGLHIESAPGQGATVRLWFPVATDAASDSAVEPEARSATDSRACLLLVDDEALVREITAEGLEAAGYAVLSVRSATEALELLDGGAAVDLLVSDLSMPGMDGLALIHEAGRRRPGLPAILLTGFATDAAELAMGGALSGAFSLLRKPVEARVLADRVAVLLEGMGEERAT